MLDFYRKQFCICLLCCFPPFLLGDPSEAAQPIKNLYERVDSGDHFLIELYPCSLKIYDRYLFVSNSFVRFFIVFLFLSLSFPLVVCLFAWCFPSSFFFFLPLLVVAFNNNKYPIFFVRLLVRLCSISACHVELLNMTCCVEFFFVHCFTISYRTVLFAFLLSFLCS